ncbi:hypothetical protein EGW08_022059 [Elysia chlorotica]|uniref:Uncharacterized protein n=1 Tax=Elysia chlorotica TaxID=188477 RepID=A0A3S0Z3Z9_ELYCH|nr:hypothetical protein EGW08_022059 [Elysia chlorotica]
MKRKRSIVKLKITKESRPSTKDTRASTTSKTGGGVKSKAGGRSPTRSKDVSILGGATDGRSAGKSGGARSDKEFAEIAIQDEGGDPASATVDEKARTPATRLGRRSKSNLAPVLESDLDSAFDLFDDQAWASVPKDEVSNRFAQFRRLSTNKLQELEDQLSLVTAKTRRKVATLKAQFQEHKGKWEAERRVLIEQVDQSIRLQGDAEKEADAAMTQLEDFISEQERLEQEEEQQRSEVLHASASLTPHSNAAMTQLEDFISEQERLEQEEEQQRSEVLHASASLTPHSNAAMTPAQGRSEDHTPTAGTPLPQQSGSPDPDGELQRLMQQTDDAKSARQVESGPASAITRSSSSGSVLMGQGLLDITKPFKEPSPSPDVPSRENSSAQFAVPAEKEGPKKKGRSHTPRSP